MKKLIILLGMFGSLVSYGFHMLPSGFDKRIDNGSGYMEYYFPNAGNKTIRYKFSSLPGSEHRGDMSEWVELYPKILTIRPEETGVLKVFIEPPKGIADGEYGFFLDAMPIEVIERGKAEEGKIGASPSVKIRASIELVGYVGDLKGDLDLVSKKLYTKNGKNYLEVKVKNKTLKRGLTLEAKVKGSNDRVKTQLMGRLVENGQLISTIELDTLEGKRPVEIEFLEEIDKNLIKKYRL